MAESLQSPPPRRTRRWLYIVGGLLIAVVLLVLALPTLISWGVGQGLIRNIIAQNVNGKVAINELEVGWFSGQSIKNLSIQDSSGREAARLNVKVDRGLLSLLTSRTNPIRVTLSGTLNGEIHADGSLSFQDLFKPSQTASTGGTPSSSTPSEPFRLPELPPVTVVLEGVDVHLTDSRPHRQFATMAIDDLRGKLVYAQPNAPITIDMQGETAADGVVGSIDFHAHAEHLFDARRRLSLRGASAKVNAEAKSIPLPVALPGAASSTMLVHALSLNIMSDDLTGKIVASLKTEGQSAASKQTPILVQADATVDKILTTTGELTLRSGAAHGTVQLQNFPFVAGDVAGNVPTMTATVVSDDLTETIDLGIDGQTQIEGFASSPLTGRLSINQLLTPNGQATFAVDRVTGNISGKTIPTALLQPALAANTPLVAARDIGPTVDLDASFSAGNTRDVSITAIGEYAQLEVKGNINPESKAISGSHLLLTSRAAHPAVVKHYTSLDVDRPTDLEIRLTSFLIPAEEVRVGLIDFAATGSLVVNGPTDVLLNVGGAQPPAVGETEARTGVETVAMTLQDVKLNIESPAMQQQLKLSGSAKLDGADVTIDEKITNLLNAEGKVVALTSTPIGTIRIENLSGHTLFKFAPSQDETIHQVIGHSLNATVTTMKQGEFLAAEAKVDSENLDVQINAMREPEILRVIGGQVVLKITPDLAAHLQRSKAEPIILAAPTTATVELQQFDLLQTPTGQYTLADAPIYASVALADAVVEKVPGFVEPLGVHELVAQVTKAREGTFTAYTVQGDVALRRPQTDQTISLARYVLKVKTRTPQDGAMEVIPKLDLGLASLNIVNLEHMLGYESGAISQWTGEEGSMAINADTTSSGYTAYIRSMLPNIAGDFEAKSDGQMLTLAAEPMTISLNRAALEKRLNAPAPEDSTAGEKTDDETDESAEDVSDETRSSSAASSKVIRVEADVPLSLSIQQVQWPLAMVQNKPFDPASVKVQLALTGGPLRMVNADEIKTAVSDLNITLTSTDLAKGVAFALKGKADASLPPATQPAAGNQNPSATTQPQDVQPGVLDVSGTVVDLVSADSTLQTSAAKLQMTAKASAMPTAVADAIVDMQGLLVAAVGPQMNATFIANNFSTSTGNLNARIETTNGWLDAYVRGVKKTLRTVKDKPVNAELAITPELRDRLLQKIHPVLADIRTTEQPLRVKIASAVFPTGGGDEDLRKLKADIEITVGKVELTSGSSTLKLLRFFEQSEKRQTIPGEIEPIIARIRKGVVKYERFSMHIDKYTLNYSGEIDLVKNTVDLRTELPLRALGQSIKELEPYADKITVPLVTRGKFGDLKTQIDPDFDIGKAALNAGFQGGLQDLLKGKGGLLDDLLKDINKKK